jgi:hypothetical protein
VETSICDMWDGPGRLSSWLIGAALVTGLLVLFSIFWSSRFKRIRLFSKCFAIPLGLLFLLDLSSVLGGLCWPGWTVGRTDETLIVVSGPAAFALVFAWLSLTMLLITAIRLVARRLGV